MNHAELRYAEYGQCRVHVEAGLILKLLEQSSNFSGKLQRGQLKAADALELRSSMAKVLEDIQFWKGEPMGIVASRLAKLADKHGMTAKGVSKHPDLLAEVDLEQSDITDRDIAEAEAKDRSDFAKLQARVEALNRKVLERERKALGLRDHQIPTTAKGGEGVPVSSKQKEGKRTKIFGFPATAVLRWMGTDHWEWKEAQKVMKHFGCDIAKNTIKIQLAAGKKGERGDPADLSLSQQKELHKISGI